MVKDKDCTRKESQQISEEKLKSEILNLQDEYQRLLEERNRLQAEQKKNAPIFKIIQSCPELRHKIERNSKCPCGSGLKYKKCCIKYETEKMTREEAISCLEELGFLD